MTLKNKQLPSNSVYTLLCVVLTLNDKHELARLHKIRFFLALRTTSVYNNFNFILMLSISINYTCKYRLKFAPNYVWTICGKCYNLKTSRMIKQVYKCGCIGYVINGKFYSLKSLRNSLELIPNKEYVPF